MLFEGIVSYNPEWVKGKTFAEFWEHEKHNGLSVEKMKEIYKLITGKEPKEEKKKTN